MAALDAIQTAVVVLGVPIALYQLRDLKRNHAATSLEALLTEWRRAAPERKALLEGFPQSGGSLEERIECFLDWLLDPERQPDERAELLAQGRQTVRSMTDLGAYLESGAMSRSLFFGQVGTHVIMLTYVLDPFVLLSAAKRGSRWGLRVRRLRLGADRYYSRSSVHRDEVIMLDGVLVWPFTERPTFTGWIPPWRLIPSKESCDAMDRRDIALAKRLLEARVSDVEQAELAL